MTEFLTKEETRRAAANPGRTRELGTRDARMEDPGSASRSWITMTLVLAAEAMCIAAFYGLSWEWLRRLHVAWLELALGVLGSPALVSGHLVSIDGYRFQVSAECTYIDLILCGMPLLWRGSRSVRRNLGVLAGFAAAVGIVNLSRVLFGVYSVSRGVSAFWAHDLLDYVLWYPTMGWVLLVWIRNMRVMWEKAPEACQDADSISEPTTGPTGGPPVAGRRPI